MLPLTLRQWLGIGLGKISLSFFFEMEEFYLSRSKYPFEQQYNDIWFFQMLSQLKLSGKLYIPDLDLWFNKKGEECEPYEGNTYIEQMKPEYAS